MIRCFSLAVLVALGATLTPSLGSAQTPATLDYRATEGCPEADRFADEVGARLGVVAFVDDAPARVVVRVVRDGEELIGTLETERGSRVFRSGACDDLVATMAAAYAVETDVPAPVLVDVPAPVLVDVLAAVGPSDDAAPAPRTVRVTVRGTEPDLGLHAVGDSAVGTGFARELLRLCIAPCEVELPVGPQQFAVSRGPGAPRVLDELTHLDGDTTLELGWRDPTIASDLGLALFVTGLLGGTLVGVLGGVLAQDDATRFGVGFGGGLGGGLALVVVGIVLAVNDVAEGPTLTVLPGGARP